MINEEIDKIEADKPYELRSWKTIYKSGKLDSFGWSLIFIWGELVLLADLIGYGNNFTWWDGWVVFFTGFGIIALLGGTIAVKFRDYDKASWNFIISFIMLGLSLGTLLNTIWIIVLVPIAIGIIIIIGTFIDKTNSRDWKNICFDGD
jgi:uncharacterized membrane protein YhaH (DUF805 family)